MTCMRSGRWRSHQINILPPPHIEMKPCRAKISSWMCTVYIHSCNPNFYTTLYNFLFPLRWVNCYGRGKDTQSYTFKWKGGVVTFTETVRQVTQCWWTTNNVNVRHKHKGTFPPQTQNSTQPGRCEAQKCLEFSRPMWTFTAHNRYCYSHLLRLHIQQLNTRQFCDCSSLVVRLFILIMHVWSKSYGTCVYQQLASGLAQYRQKWESQCGHLNSANIASSVTCLPANVWQCSLSLSQKMEVSHIHHRHSMVFHLRQCHSRLQILYKCSWSVNSKHEKWCAI
jgi:hypothetical protein